VAILVDMKMIMKMHEVDDNNEQEAQLMLTNPRDAFRGQSR